MSAEVQAMESMLSAPSAEVLERLYAIQSIILGVPQVPIATRHLIHGGMYARTISLEPATIMTGSLMRLATVLIIQGPCIVLDGEERRELDGYNVLAGCAGRKTIFAARGPVQMTMVFPTSAKTVDQAENEVFAESEMLMSRRDGSCDKITITGY